MNLWLSCRDVPTDDGIRLLCLHAAGGDASTFEPLRKAMRPANVVVLPAQLPGRAARFNEPALRSMDELIPALAAGVLPYLTKNFAFFGYSMGALVAFELARYLRDRCALHVAHLFVASRPAPQWPSASVVHRLSESALIAWSRAQHWSSGQAVPSDELLRLMLPTLRNDVELCETYAYQPRAPLRCPITCIVGEHDPSIARGAAEAWSEQSSSRFALHVLPGGHLFINPAVTPALQRLIRDALGVNEGG